MSHSHYLDVMLKLPEVANDIHARLLTAAHHCCKEDNCHVAVAWPDWKATPGEFGFLFRVFGNEQDLACFMGKADLLQKKGLIRFYPVQPVPGDVTATVCFVRDRRPDRSGDGFRKRLKARAEARGEVFELRNPERSKLPHYLNMRSETNKQFFRLHIRKLGAAPANTQSQREYGLGYTVPDF